MAMKRANGDGSVFKLTGKRRKPWAARITIGWRLDPASGKLTQEYQLIGTFATRIEAETALNDFLQNPYDINAHKLTFSEVYDLWSKEYYATLKNDSSARSYRAAYKYCEPIFNVRMRDLRVSHMQGVINDAVVGDATKSRMKSLFNLMYKYCMIHEIVDKDYSALFVQKAGKRWCYGHDSIFHVHGLSPFGSVADRNCERGSCALENQRRHQNGRRDRPERPGASIDPSAGTGSL